VLQVLTPREPGRLDAKGGGGSCGGGGGSSGGGGGSGVQSLVGASPRATPSGDYYGSAAAVRSALSSPRHTLQKMYTLQSAAHGAPWLLAQMP
jgi:hypothetical protein